MNKFKKLVGGVVLSLSLIVGLVPVTDVKASDNTIQEIENNNSAQTATEVSVSSGVTVINGSTCSKSGEEKDEYDWYKIKFEEQGKCDFRIINLSKPNESNELKDTYFNVYSEDFSSCNSWEYGLAHDAGDVYYLQVKDLSYYFYDDKVLNYQIELTESNDVEYVGGNHITSTSAYMLTEGQAAFTLGWNSSHTRYFTIEVPKGKKAEITIEPDADADLNKVIDSPFRLSLIRQSDGEKLLSNYEVKKILTLSYLEKNSSGDKIYLSGSDTYILGINGGYSPNHQWISVKYSLDNYNTDKTKPSVSGVKNGKTYKKSVTIKYSDASGIKSAKLNGKKFKSGTKVSKSGSYTVSVTDKNGNTRTVKFKIKK